jgi:hypothetical protein
MALTPEQYKKAANEVERIISLNSNVNLKNELQQSIATIADKRTQRELYRHMNALFLNVLLNRLDEVGKEKEEIAIKARQDIVELINTI